MPVVFPDRICMAKKKQRPRPNQKAKEAARAKARKAREREFMAGSPIGLEEERRKSAALMVELFGPAPEGGYALWQGYARDLIQDGADPIAAQAYAKEYYEQFEATRLRLFPEISNDELGDMECEAINVEVDKTLPNPFSVGAL
jgi:hypothetical protein